MPDKTMPGGRIHRGFDAAGRPRRAPYQSRGFFAGKVDQRPRPALLKRVHAALREGAV